MTCDGGQTLEQRGVAGTGQVPLGPQQRDDVAGLIRAEQGEHLPGRGGVAQLMCGARGERPRPDDFSVAYPEDASVSENRASVPQRVLGPAISSGGEGLGEAERRLVLGCFAGAQIPQAREHRAGGGGIAT